MKQTMSSRILITLLFLITMSIPSVFSATYGGKTGEKARNFNRGDVIVAEFSNKTFIKYDKEGRLEFTDGDKVERSSIRNIQYISVKSNGLVIFKIGNGFYKVKETGRENCKDAYMAIEYDKAMLVHCSSGNSQYYFMREFRPFEFKMIEPKGVAAMSTTSFRGSNYLVQCGSPMCKDEDSYSK